MTLPIKMCTHETKYEHEQLKYPMTSIRNLT